MPITITPAPPNGWVGPGLSLAWQSDFIGPIATDATWTVDVYLVGSERPMYQETVPTVGSKYGGARLSTDLANVGNWLEDAVADDIPVTVRVALVENSNEIDTGVITAPWKPTIGLATQAYYLAQQAIDLGGLKTDERQQLLEVHQSTALSVALDTLTLEQLPGGTPGNPISAFLADPVFGVIVRITSVPPDHSPSTPDHDYWYASLAVVRIYRGSDLWLRIPVHTSSKLVSLLNEGIVAAVPAALGALWLLNLSVQVTFAPNVTGDVYLMHFP